MNQPTNIHVDNYEPTRNRAAAGWENGEARYHVWFDTKTFKIDTDYKTRRQTIYKNPLRDVARGAPGHFDSRKLDATAAANAETVKAVFQAIERDGLIAKAQEAFAEKERQRIAQNEAYRRAERIKEAAPLLFSALERVRDAYGFDPSIDSSIWQEVETALSKARGE